MGLPGIYQRRLPMGLSRGSSKLNGIRQGTFGLFPGLSQSARQDTLIHYDLYSMEDTSNTQSRLDVDVEEQKLLGELPTYATFPFFDLRHLDRLESIFLAPPDKRMFNLLSTWYKGTGAPQTKAQWVNFLIGTKTDRSLPSHYSAQAFRAAWRGKTSTDPCKTCHQAPCMACSSDLDPASTSPSHSTSSPSPAPAPTASKKRTSATSQVDLAPPPKRQARGTARNSPTDPPSLPVAAVPTCRACPCKNLPRDSIWSSSLMDEVNCALPDEHITSHGRSALRESCENRLQAIKIGIEHWHSECTKPVASRNVIQPVDKSEPGIVFSSAGISSRSSSTVSLQDRKMSAWVRFTAFLSFIRCDKSSTEL